MYRLRMLLFNYDGNNRWVEIYCRTENDAKNRLQDTELQGNIVIISTITRVG